MMFLMRVVLGLKRRRKNTVFEDGVGGWMNV